MKKLAQIIKELENDNSRLAKEEIIKREMLNGNDALFYGLKLACSNFYTFGIKQLPSSQSSLDVLDDDTAWNLFGVLSNQLIERVITGNAAKGAVLGFASSVDNLPATTTNAVPSTSTNIGLAFAPALVSSDNVCKALEINSICLSLSKYTPMPILDTSTPCGVVEV